MKSLLRTTVLSCAAVCLSLGLAMSAAEAKTTDKEVRIAQERLMSLGYPIGVSDGAMGPLTVNALMDFQYRSNLPVTGTLTAATYTVLRQTYYSARWSGYGYGYNGYYAPANFIATHPGYYHTLNYTTDYTPVSWTGQERVVGNVRSVAIRNANLAIDEDNHGAVSNYMVVLNGTPVLNAYNQATPLRVSESYGPNGDEDVHFTVTDAYNACGYKNFLLTVHSDGSYNSVRQVDNCMTNVSYRASE